MCHVGWDLGGIMTYFHLYIKRFILIYHGYFTTDDKRISEIDWLWSYVSNQSVTWHLYYMTWWGVEELKRWQVHLVELGMNEEERWERGMLVSLDLENEDEGWERGCLLHCEVGEWRIQLWVLEIVGKKRSLIDSDDFEVILIHLARELDTEPYSLVGMWVS